jgi:hypothetical protein
MARQIGNLAVRRCASATASQGGSTMARSHAPLTFLGIAGSLRRGSYNRGLIRAAVEVAPEGTTVVPYDLGGLPMFNGDVEAEG